MNETLTWKYIKGEDLGLRARGAYAGLQQIIFLVVFTIAFSIYAASKDPAYLIFSALPIIALVVSIIAFRNRGTMVEASYTLRPEGLEILQSNRSRTIPLARIKWYALYGDDSLAAFKPDTVRKIATENQEEGKLPQTVIYLKLRGRFWSMPVYANGDMYHQVQAWLQAHGIRHSSRATGKLRPSGKYFRIAFYVFMGLVMLFCFYMAIFYQEF